MSACLRVCVSACLRESNSVLSECACLRPPAGFRAQLPRPSSTQTHIHKQARTRTRTRTRMHSCIQTLPRQSRAAEHIHPSSAHRRPTSAPHGLRTEDGPVARLYRLVLVGLHVDRPFFRCCCRARQVPTLPFVFRARLPQVSRKQPTSVGTGPFTFTTPLPPSPHQPLVFLFLSFPRGPRNMLYEPHVSETR